MSSFKRKATGEQIKTYPGTQYSPASSSIVITSTGIPSLDDLLGGGLPLSCSMLVAAPDPHSSYGELIQKYCIAEGLASSHKILIVDRNARSLLRDLMWLPKYPNASENQDHENQDSQKVKIAWRYEKLKQFQTTVGSSVKNYCHPFDLSSRLPDVVVEEALQSGQISLLSCDSCEELITIHVLRQITHLLEAEEEHGNSTPIRICIPSLGSPDWGSLTLNDLTYFLYSLRRLLRKHKSACGSIALPPQISAGWVQRLGWLSDAALTVAAFPADPSLMTIFPSHQGLVHVHTLPSPQMLLPPSDRFSTLRGLSTVSSSGGTGENNLAFKCTRKRMFFETLHLDLQGGVSERRTMPADYTLEAAPSPRYRDNQHIHPKHLDSSKILLAPVSVQLEGIEFPRAIDETGYQTIELDGPVPGTKNKKVKKKVAFHSDRLDLYDF